MNNIRDEEGIITDTEEIQRIMRTYYKNLQSTRMENLKYIPLAKVKIKIK